MTETTLGENIRLIRKRANFTMQQLAKFSGVPTVTISRIERGHTKQPRTSDLYALANALGVSIHEFGKSIERHQVAIGAPKKHNPCCFEKTVVEEELRTAVRVKDRYIRELQEANEELKKRSSVSKNDSRDHSVLIDELREEIKKEILLNYRTIEEFCFINGLCKASLSNFFSGKKELRLSTILKIAEALNKKLLIEVRKANRED